MLYELAPSLLKLLFMLKRIPSMAVSIPTKQAIPTAMIISVSAVRKKLDFRERKASLIFSTVFNCSCLEP